MSLFNKDNTILLESGGKLFKIFKITPHSDGGFDIHVPYHKDKIGYLYKIKIPYIPGRSAVPLTAIIQQKTIDKDVKLSIHKSGFVQFSGKGVISGVDNRTGKAKGLAIKISPLTSPINTGPTFGVSIWGPNNFEELTKKKWRNNYIIFNSKDFYLDPPYTKNPNTFVFECFLFKTSMAGQVTLTNSGEAVLTTNLPIYIYNRSKIFKMKVIFLKNSPVFIAILPQSIKFDSPRAESGYSLNGPAEVVQTNWSSVSEGIHLRAEYPHPDFFGTTNSMSSLAFKETWKQRLLAWLKSFR